jgi:hypothetical protein
MQLDKKSEALIRNLFQRSKAEQYLRKAHAYSVFTWLAQTF